jgi:hypothetical protein
LLTANRADFFEMKIVSPPNKHPKKPYKKIRRARDLFIKRLRVFTKIKIEGLG